MRWHTYESLAGQYDNFDPEDREIYAAHKRATSPEARACDVETLADAMANDPTSMQMADALAALLSPANVERLRAAWVESTTKFEVAVVDALAAAFHDLADTEIERQDDPRQPSRRVARVAALDLDAREVLDDWT